MRQSQQAGCQTRPTFDSLFAPLRSLRPLFLGFGFVVHVEFFFDYDMAILP